MIYEDGDEATVFIENITHGHFNPDDEKLSDAQRDVLGGRRGETAGGMKAMNPRDWGPHLAV